MSPHVQARVEAALDAPARVEPAQCANRRGSIANGGSSYIRERARELGMSMGELADRVGVSRGYMSDVARGHKNMSPHIQARVEAVLDAPVSVEFAECPTVDPCACGTGWMPTAGARTRPPGGRESAPPCYRR